MNKAIHIFLLISIMVFWSGAALAATIEVGHSYPATDNSGYDRNPSIIYDGSDYWLFYAKGDNGGTRGDAGYNPDGDTYVIYYKTASTIEGLSSATETKLDLSESARPADFTQRVVSAVSFGGGIYAFVSSGQDGTNRGLYYYYHNGSTWAGPTELIPDATARGGHVNVTTNGTYIFVAWESSDASSDCYTWDGTTLSGKIDISDGNQPKVAFKNLTTKAGGNLYVVNIEDGTGDIEVFFAEAGPSPLFASHSTAIPGGGFYDPCIFTDGTDLYVISAPYIGGDDRQYLIQAVFDNGTSSWSDAKTICYGGYRTTSWWDYWPCGYHDGTDAYVFFTSETDNGPAFGDGEIAFIKMDWDLSRDHYLFIQNGIDQAISGDDINVAAGEYFETLNITTAGLSIVGANRSTVIVDPTGLATNNAGIYVAANNVSLQSLTLRSTFSNSLPRYGVKFSDVDGCTIDDVTARDCYRSGIDALGTSNLTVSNISSLDNGGHGLSLVDCNTVSVSDVTLSGNAWQNVSVATWGRYTPLGTSGIVFSGTNSFGDLFQLEMGDYNNPGVTPAGEAVITYSTNIMDGADVTVQASDFGFALHGEQDDSPGQVRIWFFSTLENAAIVPPLTPIGHWTGNGMYMESLTDGTQLYATPGCEIQAAIDAADPYDYINVLAGTYVEALLVDKPLTMLGATAGVNKNGYTVPAMYAWDDTIESIIMHPDPASGYVTIVDIYDTDDVTFDGFIVQELSAVGNLNTSLMRVYAHSKVISNIEVINSVIGPNTNTVSQDGTHGRMGLYIVNHPYNNNGVTNSTFAGNKIFDCKGNGNNIFLWSSYYAYGAPGPASMAGTFIEDNEIYGSHRSGIETAGGFSDLVIRNNEIYDNSELPGDAVAKLKYGHGILLIRGSSDKVSDPLTAFGPVDLTIEGNNIYGNSKNGIYMGPKNDGVSIINNAIHDNGWDGVIVDLLGTYWNPQFEAEPTALQYSCLDCANDVTMYDNTIYGNGTEAYSEAEFGAHVNGVATNGFILNASGNWWGDLDPSDDVMGDVDYTPWLADGSDTDGGTAGFQGDFTSLYVDDDSPQYGTTGYIQEGVDLVDNSTVNVSAGTYTEQVTLTPGEDITLVGAGRDVTTWIAPAGGKCLVGEMTGYTGDMNYEISGFTFNCRSLATTTYGAGIYIYRANVGPMTLSIHDNKFIEDRASGDDSHWATSIFACHNRFAERDGSGNAPVLIYDNIDETWGGMTMSNTRAYDIYGNVFDGCSDAIYNGHGCPDSDPTLIFGDHHIYENTFMNASDDLHSSTTPAIDWQYYGAGAGTHLPSIIEDNTFQDNDAALRFVMDTDMSYPAHDVTGNTFIDNGTSVIAEGAYASTLDAENNYWGTLHCSIIASNVSGTVDYSPWCNSDFSYCSFTCDGASEVWVDDDWVGSSESDEVSAGKFFGFNAFGTVQDGIDGVTEGGIVHILAGSYTEQVHITKDNLDIIGDDVDGVVIVSPSSLTEYFVTGTNNNYSIVFIDGAVGTSLSNMTVDGDNQGDSNYRFTGIALWNAGGTLNNVKVLNVMNSTFSGAQHGVGIYSNNDTGGPYTIVLNTVLVDDFQKSAIALAGSGLTVDLDNVTTIGEGPTDVTAQNGIQVGPGVLGTVDNCSISLVDWTGGTWTATGFLNDGNVTATGLVIDQCQTSVYWTNGTGVFDNGTITNPTGDAFYAYNSSPAKSSGPRVLPQPFDDGSAKDPGFKTPMTVTLSNSTITGTGAEFSWGVGAFSTGDAVNLIVENCYLSNWDYALFAYDYGYGGAVDLSASDNSITSCTYAFGSTMANTQNGAGNWLGTNDPAVVATLFDGDIDYSPWLNSATEISGDPGFQGDFSNIWVDNDSPQFGPDLHIQEGINTVDGSTVNVAPGTYTENIDVNKYVEIIGAGSGTDPASNTIITQNPTGAGDTKIGVIQLTASGDSEFTPTLLKDLRVAPDGMAGLSVGRFTEGTGADISYIKLDNVFVIGNNVNPNTEQERGLYVDLTSTLSYLTILNSAFDSLTYGWYFQKEVSSDASTVQNVSVTGTSFNHNNHKGIYAEKLTEATFTECTISENGFTDVGMPTYFVPWMCGIDINLKAGTYQNLAFNDCIVTDNALGGAKEGVGLTIKGRGTGNNPSGSYIAFPAWVDNVIVTGGTYTGNERGLRFGEPGKENASPTNVAIHDATIHDNIQTYTGTDGSAYGDVINQMMAGISVDAESNYWGTLKCSEIAALVSGEVDYSPWCNSDFSFCSFTCEGAAEVWVDDGYSETGMNDGHTWQFDAFEVIQNAINSVADGGIVHVKTGNYTEQILIDSKDLTLDGAGIGLAKIFAVPTGERVPYDIVQWNGTTRSIDACLGVTNCASVDISGFTIEGGELGPNNFYGIHFFNSSGSVNTCRIKDVTYAASPSSSRIVSLAATHGDGESITVDFSNNQIPNFQKGGIVIMGPGVTCVVNDNDVEGAVNPALAPNGIQISYGSTGTLNNNNVDGVGYQGDDWAGTGILLFECDDVSVTGGEVTNNEVGIGHSQWNWIYTPSSTPTITIDDVSLDGNEWTIDTHLGDDGAGINLEVMNCNITNAQVSGVGLWGSDVDPWGGSYYGGWINGTADINVHDNNFAGGNYGVTESVELPTGNTVNCAVNNNAFSGLSGLAVENDFTNMIDATGNWWDDISGPGTPPKSGSVRASKTQPIPYSPTDGPAVTTTDVELNSSVNKGTGEAVSANVDYSPWWGRNYLGDSHASGWLWMVDQSNGSSIQEGIDFASETVYDTVIVTDGIYAGGISFMGKAMMLSSHTVIDGDPAHIAMTLLNDYSLSVSPDTGSVVRFVNGETSASLLANLMLRGGIGTVDATLNRHGGGILCDGASPTIQNCVVYYNTAARGGGIACLNGTPTITNTTINRNTAAAGGGLYCENSSPAISNTIIAFSMEGEAVYCLGEAANPTFSCSDIYGNLGGDYVGCLAGMNGTNGNISANPVFCESHLIAHGLDALSPCAPSHPMNSCGSVIGAFDVTCSECVDNDGDFICDAIDNCTDEANMDQLDTDGDGVGDACDNCVDVVNPGQEDSDSNGIGDACESGAVCGDANGDGEVNVGDAVYVINSVFKEGPDADPLCSGDANGDGEYNVGDAVYLINLVFKEGPDPVTPCCFAK